MGKHKSTSVYKYYNIEGDSVKRTRLECPRCGRGYFMAEHKDRYTCGACKYTKFKTKS
jgi:small subunit ribosomal protein S27Ae